MWVLVVIIIVGLAWLTAALRNGRMPGLRRVIVTRVGAVAGVLSRSLPDDMELEEFRRALWQRYTDTNGGEADEAANRPVFTQHGDRLLAHVDRVLDRQINKARGILPFNSIIMTTLSIERMRLGAEFQPAVLVILVGLAVSSCFCLKLFLVSWDVPANYLLFVREVKRTTILLRARAGLVELSVWISGACLLAAMLVVLAGELSAPPPRTESTAPVSSPHSPK